MFRGTDRGRMERGKKKRRFKGGQEDSQGEGLKRGAQKEREAFESPGNGSQAGQSGRDPRWETTENWAQRVG